MFNSMFFESIQRGLFLFGFNPASKVDNKLYRRYVSFISAITEVLKDYDINIKNKGYSYIVDAVLFIMDQNKLDIKLNDDIYPLIRRKYNLNNIAIVEHCIRNAIKSAYVRCHNSPVNSRMREYAKKPSNKQFLLAITQEVTHKMCTDFLISSN